MKRLLFLTLLTIPFAAGLVASEPLGSMTRQERVNLVRDEVVGPYFEVGTNNGTGAGVLISWNDEQLILTAAHVVQNARPGGDGRPNIITRGKGEMHSIECEVVGYSPVVEAGGYDLALLKPSKKLERKPARLILDLDLGLGEDALMVGTPNHMHAQLDRCLLSNLDYTPTGFSRPVNVVTGAGWFGNSGGPVYVIRDGHYVLAGITTHLDSKENPKSPCYLQTPASIRLLLEKDYKPGQPLPADGVGLRGLGRFLGRLF